MATKKDIEKETEIEEKTEEQTGERKIKIMLPYSETEGDVFVSVNARTFLIQRGVEVEVPECVYEVLREKDRALMKAHNAARQFETE
jgi:hypothetical protein